MARAVPLFWTPSITKNGFTVLPPSPTSQTFYTKTSHSTHSESQLCEIQVFDTKGSQNLLTLLGRVQKNIFLFLQTV
jgi:hypothetical protein